LCPDTEMRISLRKKHSKRYCYNRPCQCLKLEPYWRTTYYMHHFPVGSHVLNGNAKKFTNATGATSKSHTARRLCTIKHAVVIIIQIAGGTVSKTNIPPSPII